ncbi:Uncharacterized protein BWINRASL_01028 [Bacillus mycoides]|nr:Uncharacterized protein BWINRASL_01028 [Bacillus mycoides]
MIDTLYEQAQNKPVEILVLLENKKRTTGEKRNILVEQAKGEYVAFVDDDEWGTRVSQGIVNQVRIPTTLYHYDFVPKLASWYT